MLHGIDITITPLTGRCKGLWKTEPIDVIWATRNGQTRKLGYVGHPAGSTVLLVRHLKTDMREPVRREVERLRMESGGESISQRISCPPDPELIKAYVKGDLQKSAKTTIVMPDGTPAEIDDTPEDNVDE